MLDPLPPGLVWSGSTGRFVGSPTEGGVYQVATTLMVEESERAGAVAFDITPRETDLVVSSVSQEVILGNGRAVLLNRNARTVEVTDYNALDSGAEAVFEGSSWSSSAAAR